MSRTERANPSPRPMVLLADDDPDSLALLREAIAQGGVACAVREVTDGAQVLDYLHRRGRFATAPRPALVYLDIEMPVLTGLEVLQVIKRDPALRDIPVVVMTSLADESQQARALRSGAEAFVLKPVAPQTFAETVRRLALGARRPAAKEAQAHGRR